MVPVCDLKGPLTAIGGTIVVKKSLKLLSLAGSQD